MFYYSLAELIWVPLDQRNQTMQAMILRNKGIVCHENELVKIAFSKAGQTSANSGEKFPQNLSWKLQFLPLKI